MFENGKCVVRRGHKFYGKGLPLTLDILQQRFRLMLKPSSVNFSSKPGTLLWTRTLGTITSYCHKPTKALREHELHGHEQASRYVTLNSV